MTVSDDVTADVTIEEFTCLLNFTSKISTI